MRCDRLVTSAMCVGRGERVKLCPLPGDPRPAERLKPVQMVLDSPLCPHMKRQGLHENLTAQLWHSWHLSPGSKGVPVFHGVTLLRPVPLFALAAGELRAKPHRGPPASLNQSTRFTEHGIGIVELLAGRSRGASGARTGNRRATPPGALPGPISPEPGFWVEALSPLGSSDTSGLEAPAASRPHRVIFL